MMYVHDTKVDAYNMIYDNMCVYIYICKCVYLYTCNNQRIFVLFHCRSKGGSKPCSEKKNHEHGTNQSTHPSFMETCKQLGNSATDFVEFRHRL